MKHKVEFLTGTNNRNFYKDLEEIISTMERENEKFSKYTILKHIVKIPNNDKMLEPGTFAQILEKYGSFTYELKGEHELIKINYEGLVNKTFEGSCIVEVHNSYWDARKTIILSVQEIVVTGPTFPHKVVCNLSLEEESSEEDSSSRGQKESPQKKKASRFKNIQYRNFLKMPTPLTIENFQINKLRAKTPELKKSGNVTYFVISFDYDGGDPLMKIEGNFRVFKHVNAGRVNYLLAINTDDKNEEFFSELRRKIATLACENKTKFTKLKSLKPSDPELIKTTGNGKYKNVYARIYTNKTTRKVSCRLSERKKVKDVFKRRKIKIDNLVDESFIRSCIVRVYQVYVGSSKTITLYAERIMFTKLTLKRSYFDEYEEMVVMSHHQKKQIKMSLLVLKIVAFSMTWGY